VKLAPFAAAVSLAVLGCDGAATVPPGRQLATGRDLLYVYFWNPNVLGYLRGAASGNPETQDLWVRHLDAGEPRRALADVDWTPPSWDPNWRVGNLVVSGGFGQQGYDIETELSAPLIGNSVIFRRDGGDLGAYEVRLDPLAPTSAGPTDVIAVGRPGASTTLRGLVPTAVDFLGTDLAVWGRRAADGATGLFRMGRDDGAITQLLTAPPPDVKGGSDLLAASCLGGGPTGCTLFHVLGCTPDTPACPGSGRPPCVVLFARQADTVDAATTPDLSPRAYDVDAASERDLGGAISQYGFQASPDGRAAAWHDVSTAGRDTLAVWDACGEKVSRCDVAMTADNGPQTSSRFLQTAWRPDSAAVAATFAYSSPLVVATRAGDVCVAPPEADAAWNAAFDASGRRLTFVETGPAGGTLFAADGLGRSPRSVATGVLDLQLSTTGRFAILQRDGDSLSSLDLDAPDGAERWLAGPVIRWRVGAGRLLALTDWSSQDLTGHLESFDLPGGTSSVLVDLPVVTFGSAGPLDDGGPLAYVVRDRVSSARDGLWLTTFPPAGAP
jgi:hypothetical protein